MNQQNMFGLTQQRFLSQRPFLVSHVIFKKLNACMIPGDLTCLQGSN